MSDLVGNPEDRFSHNEAHIITNVSKSEVSSLLLSSVAVQPGSCLPEDRFSLDTAQMKMDGKERVHALECCNGIA